MSSSSTAVTAQSLDARLQEHFDVEFSDPLKVLDLSQHFRREGYVKLRNLVSEEVWKLVTDEVYELLDRNAKRIDIRLKETGNTPRYMSTVGQTSIAEQATVIPTIYHSQVMMDFL